MKRKSFASITIFIIITITILTYYYLNSTYTYQRIDVYTAKDFNKEKNTPILSINDKSKLKEISTIIRKSEKMPGVLNVVSPEYILEMYDVNKNIKTVYLWIGRSSVNGMYMYKDNTVTGYSISVTNAQKLRKIMITTND